MQVPRKRNSPQIAKIDLSPDQTTLGPKNSPSRFRFRPPCRLAFGFRLPPPGWASTYSRSVLGASRTLGVRLAVRKASRTKLLANCEERFVVRTDNARTKKTRRAGFA